MRVSYEKGAETSIEDGTHGSTDERSDSHRDEEGRDGADGVISGTQYLWTEYESYRSNTQW